VNEASGEKENGENKQTMSLHSYSQVQQYCREYSRSQGSSEIFFYYDQMCYPTTRTETWRNDGLFTCPTIYSPVQPSDMAKVQKSCTDFLLLFLNV
jgi:hypothetical protein